ncbi:ionotropic receptor 21a-like [Centruroides vittatus]|uniref:ionotropic receptor 21a-like n=1 Tax=Centruroides vittatus TaxID=120091 RepID=UPI003510CDCA
MVAIFRRTNDLDDVPRLGGYDRQCSYRIIAIFIVNPTPSIQALKIGISYEVAKPIQDKVIGRNELGEYTGCFGQVVKSEADILFKRIFLTYDRIQVSDFSTAVSTHPNTFLLLVPKMKFSWNALFRPFSFQVWLLIFASFITSGFALYFMIRAYYKIIGKAFGLSFRKIFWFLFSTLSNQESNILSQVNHYSLRLTIGSWLLAVLVLLSSYSGCLVSFLTASEEQSIPKTFHQLASAVKNGDYECGIYANVAVRTFLMESKTEDGSILKEHLTFNNNYFTEMDVVVRHLQNRRLAIISTKSKLKKLKQQLRGNVFISDDTLLIFSSAFAMNKEFSYKRELNTIISNWISTGVTDKIYGLKNDADEEIPVQAIHPLKLEELGGAFILLLIGYALSFSSLISELLIAKLTKKVLLRGFLAENTFSN